MKIQILIILLISNSSHLLFAQGPLVYWEYEINPITENQLLWQTANDSSVWHYGQSYKPFFGSSTTELLVTDTLNMYSANTSASVEIILTRPYSDGNVELGTAYVLSFEHKIDTDTNSAGGFVDINIDNDSIKYIHNGDTLTTFWLRYLMPFGSTSDVMFSDFYYQMITDNGDTIYMHQLTIDAFHNYYHEINGYRDTLFDSSCAFTGTYDQWQEFYTEMFFNYGGVKTADQNDSLIFRLNFISDNTSFGKNGWALKNIQSGYAVHPTGSISEADHPKISVYPNPANNYTLFKVNEIQNEQPLELTIYSADGRKFEVTNFTREILIDVSMLNSGIYYYQIIENGDLIQASRFIKY